MKVYSKNANLEVVRKIVNKMNNLLPFHHNKNDQLRTKIRIKSFVSIRNQKGISNTLI